MIHQYQFGGYNIVLDVWFVAGFGMGIEGVALATVIAQGISSALCLFDRQKVSGEIN